MKRIVAVASVMALLAACSPSTGESTTTPPETTSTSTIPSTTPTTTGSSTTSTTAGTTSTTAPTTTTTTTPETVDLSAFFLIDEAGHDQRSGPFLVPVNRTVPYTVGVARAAIEQLLAGPTDGETVSVPAISSQVPEGSELNDVGISDGTATVDLNAAFGASDQTAAAAVRVAQVVFTLTQFPTVDDVQFLEDGETVSVQTSQGDLVSRPVGRDDYRDFEAIVSVDQPAYGGSVENPMRVTGEAAVFEAVFQYALTDADGKILTEGNAMTSEGNTWAPFDFTIDYTIDTPQVGALIVWVDSAKDGSRIDIREYPVHLTP